MTALNVRLSLSERSLEVLKLRYEGKTYEVIGEQFDVTRARAKIIHTEALNKLIYSTLLTAGLVR